MNGDRGGFRPVRREQLLEGFGHDSYKSKAKLPDPTRCPECGATFRKGRWTCSPLGRPFPAGPPRTRLCCSSRTGYATGIACSAPRSDCSTS